MTTSKGSMISRFGVNAANFWQAESVGVVLPVMSGFLKAAGWSYSAIGVATAVAGLGTLLLQTPAGILVDRFTRRRLLFGVVSVAVGAAFASLPLIAHSKIAVDALLFVAGALQTFFAPILAALALALVGHGMLNKFLGQNQAWNHAGNLVAAIAAIAVVKWAGTASIFYAVAFASAIAAGSVFLIRESELDEQLASGKLRDSAKGQNVSCWYLLRDRTIMMLFVSIALFHLANAPILPIVALYVKKLGGSDALMTSTVLTAQAVMVPVAWLAGRLCDSWGRKPVMLLAFWILPLRIFLYSLAHSAAALVALQALDGIGAGIYGMVVVAFCADLTRGTGGFNTLMGLFATALALGGVIGPLIAGWITQHLGFGVTFTVFAVLAAVGAATFTIFVPETRTTPRKIVQPLAA
jgi:MFS family permease